MPLNWAIYSQSTTLFAVALERVNPSQFPCYHPYFPGLRFYLLPTYHEFECAPFVEPSNII